MMSGCHRCHGNIKWIEDETSSEVFAVEVVPNQSGTIAGRLAKPVDERWGLRLRGYDTAVRPLAEGYRLYVSHAAACDLNARPPERVSSTATPVPMPIFDINTDHDIPTTQGETPA